jgi:hypothetical protein
MMEEKCKNPLAWWIMHEVWFPYVGFVAQQTLGILGS